MNLWEKVLTPSALFCMVHRRMHEDDEVAAAFNGWKWLGMGGDRNDAGLTQSQQEENALYALGVAGLASKKLLQKHRVSSERVGAVAERSAPVGSTVVNDVAKAADEEAKKQSHTKIVHCAYEVVHSVSKARRTLHECQSHQLRAAAQVAVRAPITMGRKLFQLGGGEKTVSLTAAVALALVFVLIKPAVHFVASESVNMTRGA